MKIIKITLLLISIISITIILLLQVDDDINPEVKQAYEQVTTHKESKAYIYFLGFLADVDVKPEVMGKKIYESFLESKKSSAIEDVNPSTYNYPAENNLPLFTLEAQTKIYVETLFLQKFDSSKLSKKHQVLFKRYKQFMVLDDYHTLATPGIYTPLEPYLHIISGNDLLLLHAIEDLKKGNVNKAKKSILDNITYTRIQLSNADSVIGKATYIAILSKNLDVLAVLARQYKAPFEGKVAPLTTAEKDVTKTLKREFIGNHSLYKSLDRSSNLLQSDTSQIPLPHWVNRIFFKPNMSLNALYPEYKKLIDIALLLPEDFAKVAENITTQSKVSFLTRFRNSVGAKLSSIGLPNHNDLRARSIYLGGKIALFNQVAVQATLPKSLAHTQNPFYKNKTAFYSDDNNQVCFDGPFLKRLKQSNRCLKLKINMKL